MSSIFRPVKVNYFYFFFLFACLLLVHGFHVLLVEPASVGTQLSFLIDVALQCLLEVVLLFILGHVIRAFFSKTAFYVYISFTFLLLVVQIIDFFLIRVMDMTIWTVIRIVKEESFRNLLESTNISLRSWGMFMAVLMVLPLVGLLVFFLFEKWEKKREQSLKNPIMLSIVLLGLLTFWDLSAIFPSSPVAYEQLRKTLPLKSSLFAPEWPTIHFPEPLVQNESIFEQGSLKLTALKEKPDVFLFIFESLREDFITPKIAPYLSQFRNENVSFDLSLSSANATHLSWFSLFHSKFPFYWSSGTEKAKKEGSLPIRLFKEMGYSINVYSSAQLGFYEMDERIFGEGRHLADNFFMFSHDGHLPACESDEKTMHKLFEEMKKEKGGRLHIVFLDSTHFDYSWPKETGSLFVPIQEELDYLKAAYSKAEVEGIKNRYRNAIYYLDSLFGQFLQTLQETKNSEEAVVVVTGDHGEEFYENNHIFHASTLNEAQTHVPIYYKFGRGRGISTSKKCAMTSHVDIFPTLFHYLLKEDKKLTMLHGESIFKTEKWPYAITARYNAGNTPTEFSIHNGKNRIVMRFGEDDIFKTSRLSIVSVKDRQDQNVPINSSSVHGEFGQAFDRLFSR
jgi:glucan phosphoethanolaminetransferase (alkaline phosphatase superfamily)